MKRSSTQTSLQQFSALRGALFLMLVSMLLLSRASFGQTLISENFDVTPAPLTNVPLGWATGKINGVDPLNLWDRINNTATNPTCTPRSLSNMARYQADILASGESAFLASKKLDFRGWAAAAPVDTVGFWMYRDPGVGADNINVYLNTSPDFSGAPILLTEIRTGVTTVNRECGLNPPATNCPVNQNTYLSSAWHRYAYSMSAALGSIAAGQRGNVYVIIVGTSSQGNNIYIDDFNIQTFPLTQTYVSSAVVFQNTSTTQANSSNQMIIGCRITMDGVTTPKQLTEILFNTNGSDNPGVDISGVGLWYTGGTNSFSTSATQIGNIVGSPNCTNFGFRSAANSPCPNLWDQFAPAAAFTLEHGDNYFWITYNLPVGATGGNYVDAEMVSVTFNNGGGGPHTPSPASLAGARLIDIDYCVPNMSAGTSWPGGGYYNNDYVAGVKLNGNLPANTGINTGYQPVFPVPAPAVPNYFQTGPNWGDCDGTPFANSNCPFVPHPNDYHLWPTASGRTTQMTADGVTNYTLTAWVGTWFGSNYIAAWIDLNKDAAFSNVPITAGGERIGQSGPLANGASVTFNFTIPATALANNYRLRVREVYATNPINACQGYTWGECEDYTITILPVCNGAAFGAPPGYNKVWLGFTDDWDLPSNWCGGVPTLLDAAYIPPFGAGARPGAYHPKIKANVFARAGRLRIADSLTIMAPANSNLWVNDSLIVQTGKTFRVINTFGDTAQVSNGTLTATSPTNYNLFRPSNKVRAFIVYSASEFAAKGMMAGDIIDSLYFHVQRANAGNGNDYNNVTIKQSYILPGQTFVCCGFGSLTQPGQNHSPIGAVNTIFTGTIPATGVASGAYAVMRIPLIPGSFVWNGSANDIMIEICYDNPVLTAGYDVFRYTQTIGVNTYALIWNNTSPSACAMVPPADPGGVPAAQFFQTDRRPNITFKYTRPFNQYQMEMRRHWLNDGNFIAGGSKVTFNHPGGLTQNITGTSPTTFYDLTVQTTAAGNVTRLTDFTVTNILHLQQGRLKLNGGTVHLTNPEITGLTRVSGYLESETTVQPYGNFHWNMIGTTSLLPSTRIIPFVNTAGNSIFVDYKLEAGDHDVTFATYATPPNNLPMPDDQPAFPMNIAFVDNINAYYTGLSNDFNMVNRYWKIYNAVATASQADISIRYQTVENAASGNTGMMGQRWVSNANSTTTPGPGWEYPFLAGQAFAPAATPTASTLTVNDFTDFANNIWWAIVRDVSPLPISLLDFTAKAVEDKVKIDWSTASEINNSHFIVERSINNKDFTFIDRVESKGPNSTTLQSYTTWDNEPLMGIQYYYLTQYDRNGDKTTYGPVPVEFRSDIGFEITTAIVSPTNSGITVTFSYNSSEPYTYTVMDMLGQIVVTKANNPATPGHNVIDINATLSKGVYQVVLQNSQQTVTRKLFY